VDGDTGRHYLELIKLSMEFTVAGKRHVLKTQSSVKLIRNQLIMDKTIMNVHTYS